MINALAIYLNLGFYLCDRDPGHGADRERACRRLSFFPTVGPFTLNLNNLTNCLFVLSLAIIMFCAPRA